LLQKHVNNDDGDALLITKHVVATAEFSVDMIIINISLVYLVKTEPNLVIVIQSPTLSTHVDFCPVEKIDCAPAACSCHSCPALIIVLPVALPIPPIATASCDSLIPLIATASHALLIPPIAMALVASLICTQNL